MCVVTILRINTLTTLNHHPRMEHAKRTLSPATQTSIEIDSIRGYQLQYTSLGIISGIQINLDQQKECQQVHFSFFLLSPNHCCSN